MTKLLLQILFFLTCSKPMRRFSMRKRVPSRGIFIILLVKADALRAGHQTEDGSWPENRKSCANVFICMLHVVALSIFVYTTKRLFLSLFFFLFCEFKLLRVQPCWFTLYQWGAEKINGFWWHNVFDLKRKKLTAHTSLVFSFIEMQTGRHETAALMVLFLRLSEFGC